MVQCHRPRGLRPAELPDLRHELLPVRGEPLWGGARPEGRMPLGHTELPRAQLPGPVPTPMYLPTSDPPAPPGPACLVRGPGVCPAMKPHVPHAVRPRRGQWPPAWPSPGPRVKRWSAVSISPSVKAGVTAAAVLRRRGAWRHISFRAGRHLPASRSSGHGRLRQGRF